MNLKPMHKMHLDDIKETVEKEGFFKIKSSFFANSFNDIDLKAVLKLYNLKYEFDGDFITITPL